MNFRWDKNHMPNPNRSSREWTPGRIAAAKRAVKREQEAVPLFPEISKYQTVEDRMTEVDRNSYELRKRLRDHAAANWRKVRKQLREMPAITRAGVIRYWNEMTIPHDGHYLLGMIRKCKHESPWRWVRILYCLKHKIKPPAD